MLPVRVKVALAGLAIAGGGVVAALLGPARPAVGQSSQPIQEEIQVNSPATLVARGAGAYVPVTANCSGPLVVSGNVSVTLSERAASAVGSAKVDCTGTNQTVQVLVTTQVGKALKKGTAIATATLNVCTTDFSFCGNQQAQNIIQIDS